MDQKELQAILESNLGRQLHWIGAADAKLGFVFTLVTAMLGLLAVLAPKAYIDWTPVSFLFTSAATAFGFTCLAFLSIAAFPRTSGPKNSMIYCGGIAERNALDYAQCAKALSTDAYLEDLIAQCHRNAEIATIKFRLVRKAQIALHVSVPLWLCSVWLLYRGH